LPAVGGDSVVLTAGYFKLDALDAIEIHNSTKVWSGVAYFAAKKFVSVL
jgi:hypothetical protein